MEEATVAGWPACPEKEALVSSSLLLLPCLFSAPLLVTGIEKAGARKAKHMGQGRKQQLEGIPEEQKELVQGAVPIVQTKYYTFLLVLLRHLEIRVRSTDWI